MTLTNYIKTHGVLNEISALKLCMQLCDGLRDIHRLGYIHKDLKPDNIMVCSTQDVSGLPLLKIIDFGVSDISEKIEDTTLIKTHIEDAGTEGYNPHDKKITPRWDVYSIGCILNFMLTGHTPDMDPYKGSLAVHNIIEHATDDFSLRYSSVTALYMHYHTKQGSAYGTNCHFCARSRDTVPTPYGRLSLRLPAIYLSCI